MKEKGINSSDTVEGVYMKEQNVGKRKVTKLTHYQPLRCLLG